MATVNEKMTALANEVRTLTGTTDSLSISHMTSALRTENINFNTNLSAQDDLIAQIQTALQGKAAGGGGSSSPDGPGSGGPDSGAQNYLLQDKNVTPSTIVQAVSADPGYYGLNTVMVDRIPSSYVQPSGTKAITTNGAHDVKSYESVSVNVASTGEEVTAETNAYTEKVAQLTTAVTALENELAGKASGGTGGGNIEYVIGSVDSAGPIMPGSTTLNGIVHYMNQEGVYSTTNVAGEIFVMKDSILVGYGPDGVWAIGGVTPVGESLGSTKSYLITDDFSIKV